MNKYWRFFAFGENKYIFELFMFKYDRIKSKNTNNLQNIAEKNKRFINN